MFLICSSYVLIDSDISKMTNSEVITLRLKWRKTRDDREDDFIATSPNFPGHIGRFHRHVSSSNGGWSWSFQASELNFDRTAYSALNVRDPTAREAVKRIEDV